MVDRMRCSDKSESLRKYKVRIESSSGTHWKNGLETQAEVTRVRNQIRSFCVQNQNRGKKFRQQVKGMNKGLTLVQFVWDLELNIIPVKARTNPGKLHWDPVGESLCLELPGWDVSVRARQSIIFGRKIQALWCWGNMERKVILKA